MLEMILQHFLPIPPKVGKTAEVFRGIYVGDCTSLALPGELHDTFGGCGNQYDQAKASLKTFCRYGLFSGNYRDFIFGPGKGFHIADSKSVSKRTRIKFQVGGVEVAEPDRRGER